MGYDRLTATAEVKAVVKDGKRVESLCARRGGRCFGLTLFYAEMGGEVGDTYTIEAEVRSGRGYQSARERPCCPLCEGCRRQRACRRYVRAIVDELRRKRITRNHTCTHLLHAALREVLGDHVKQAGSYVGPDRLRFDFTHFEGMTAEQISEVERVANNVIMQALPMNIYETSLDEARESGVTGLFGEKYGDVVRVVEAGEFW
ncbi:MAG: hypothetical protein ACLT98_11990 [Eggerthellaceae bacterium]